VASHNCKSNWKYCFLTVDFAGDERVFNYPIFGYSFQYFNPQEAWSWKSKVRAKPTSLAKAMVRKTDFHNDPHKGIRNQKTQSILGIAMCITYIGNPKPNQSIDDTSSPLDLSSAGYLYDIELDNSNKIIDGKWYKYLSRTPEFVWLFPDQTHAETEFDANLAGEWANASAPAPKTWRHAAVKASNLGMPLAQVVNALICFARTSA
jgi:hypothetical protein